MMPVANRPIWTKRADWRGETKPPLGTPLNRDHWAAKNLVGCWLLNEGAGNIAYDSAGANNGTLSGFSDPATATSGWCSGPYGGALRFDGSNDVVSFPAINPISRFTVVFSFSPKRVTGYNAIIGIGDGAGAPGARANTGDIRLQDGNIDAYWHGAGKVSMGRLGTTYLSTASDYFVMVIFQSGQYPKIYINGVEEGVASGPVQTIEGSAWMLKLGKNLYDDAAAASQSIISHFSIYSDIIILTSILSLYPFCMFGDSND